MFARQGLFDRKAQRRGIVLVLILGMLALLALIGVTFASISGQAQSSSRKYAESLLIPDAKKMFDYGLNQLINDTQNPLSAMFGHSLLRDMYGNDGQHNGGPLATAIQGSNFDYANRRVVVQTTTPAYLDASNTALMMAQGEYGKSPIGWVLKVSAPGYVSMSLEIVGATVNNGSLVVYTHLPDPDPTYTILTDPNYQLLSIMAQPVSGVTAVLDGSFLRAFNGAGQTSYALAQAVGMNNPLFTELYRLPNHFRSGLASAIVNNQVPMDEDYDACDLENMFLAIESADSSVVIPSFHRPSIIRYQVNPTNPSGNPLMDDWKDLDNVNTSLTQAQRVAMSSSRFLRPRLIDHPTSGLKDLKPDPVTGKIEYDVDNDGDGVTDSVWIDLGFPPQRDANGKLYKPMFAFKVIGLNGKLPLNTAGNLQARSLRDLNDDNLPDNEPMWDHASHLGYSVNEINPKYALQNYPGSPQVDDTGSWYINNGVADTSGVPVNLTQLRNLLMGTRPMPAPDQQVAIGTPNWDPVNGIPYNGDANTVMTGSRLILMPNNVPDQQDSQYAVQSWIYRNVPAVPGLWGEEQGVPQKMPADSITLLRTAADLNNHTGINNLGGYGVLPNNTYYSRVGPGRSPALIDYLPPSPNQAPFNTAPYPLYATDIDGTNDTYSAYDFYNGTVPSPTGAFSGPELGNLADAYTVTTPTSTYALEFPNLPSERFRSFVSPVDVSGNGLMGKFYTVPVFNYDAAATYKGAQFGGLNNTNAGNRTVRGYGPDQWGRVSYFNYFRPPGVPFYFDTRAQVVGGVFTALPIIPDANSDSNYLNDSITGNRHNLYHGYEAARSPRFAHIVTSSSRATDFADAFLGAMPYNISNVAQLQNPANNPNHSTAPALSKYPADSGWTSGAGTLLAPTLLVDTATNSYLGTFDSQINTLDNTKSLVYSTVNGSSYYHPTIYGSMPAYSPPSNPTAMGPDPYPGGSLGRDLAHEVNLYRPDSSDRPYTNHDLEWLYRQQDVDGANLESRLKYLAPVSFVYSPDAPMRRKMFSVETWELNNFTWAYDNPAGAFPNNTSFGPILASAGNASIISLNNPTVPLISPGLTASYLNTGNVLSTPAYAHRNRKINLNAPFPITNDPDDPVRKKWVYDTYQALKQILPPKSIDTPEELLALSQYVLNIVDSRDSDAAMTHFINPDVRQTPPDLGDPAASPPKPPLPPTLVMSTVWNGTSYSLNAAFANALPIDQYGMENQPIAINEALAYRFYRRNNSATNPNPINLPTPRFWLELVNTVTQGGQGTVGNVDPSNWEILIAPDDAWGRPNPFTGQVNYDPSEPANGQKKRKGNPKDPVAKDVAWPKSWRIPGIAPALPALKIDTDHNADNAANYYYVIGMAAPSDDANGTGNPPPPVNQTAVPFEAGMPVETGNVAPNYLGPDPGENNGPIAPTSIAPQVITAPGLTPPTGVTIQALIPAKNKNATPPRYGYLFDADDDNDQIPDASPGAYYWVYLRRPANPLDPTSTKVVVDSIRIPYAENTTIGEDNGTEVRLTQGQPVNGKNQAVELPAFNQAMYSLARLQPYRGGQLVPTLATLSAGPMPTLVTTPAQADYRYGYTEQHFHTYYNRPAVPSGNDKNWFGLGLFSRGLNTNFPTSMMQAPTTDRIYHSLGHDNYFPGQTPSNQAISGSPARDDANHPTILDRDFTNVVELTTVPACPPGLFTKQFIETPVDPLNLGVLPGNGNGTNAPQFPFYGATTPVAGGTAPTRTAGSAGPSWVVPGGGQRDGNPIPATTIPVYPYLADQFFYTAANSNFSWDAANNVFVYDHSPAFGGTPVVGGASGAGWHKMFELFEVPSSSMGAIGPVSQGTNFDWYREDRRPGQLNINLIIDEEVFFGLIDDETVAKLNKREMSVERNVALYPSNAPPANFPTLAVPRVVTQVDANGFPSYIVDANGARWTGSHAMNNRGFDSGLPAPATDPQDGTLKRGLMKTAFADFLKLRHGGSGFLFSYGIGSFAGLAPVGSGPVGPLPDISTGGITTPPAMDRPFHSLSYPDIDYTIMRPATLPPSTITDSWPTLLNPALPPRGIWLNAPLPDDPGQAAGTAPFFPANSNYTLNGFSFVGDPGVKTSANVETDTDFNSGASTPLIEPFPGRPSNPASTDFATGSRRNWMPSPTPPRRLFQLTDASAVVNANVSTYDTNAGLEGDIRYYLNGGVARSSPRSQIPVVHPTLFQPEGDLVPKFEADDTTLNMLKLGGYRVKPNTDGQPIPDRRQNPAFRNEWLQKVVNLSTVRTHQYAVWLTVGFFEVAQSGDPVNLVPDQLGPEIGAAAGQNVRFRGFFVIDRTLANGFDPTNPADFRRVVTHWRRIE
ncbi:MAG: hypothetical protein U0800_05755 [Isosphaeraceae bacterium]